jgi:hypothetical protein
MRKKGTLSKAKSQTKNSSILASYQILKASPGFSTTKTIIFV